MLLPLEQRKIKHILMYSQIRNQTCGGITLGHIQTCCCRRRVCVCVFVCVQLPLDLDWSSGFIGVQAGANEARLDDMDARVKLFLVVSVGAAELLLAVLLLVAELLLPAVAAAEVVPIALRGVLRLLAAAAAEPRSDVPVKTVTKAALVVAALLTAAFTTVGAFPPKVKLIFFLLSGILKIGMLLESVLGLGAGLRADKVLPFPLAVSFSRRA